MQILEVDKRARMRSGDLSVTGVLVSIRDCAMRAGARVRLRLATRDKEQRVEVDARVVRCVSDGVAFEFLPADVEEREALAMLFVHVARAQIRHTPQGVRPRSEPPIPSGVHTLSVETDWQLRRGERVIIELPGPEGGSVRLEGQAVRSRASKSGTFRTRIEMGGVLPTLVQSKKSSEETTLVDHPSPIAGTRDLMGDLSQIRAPSLLSLAAMERMSGVLELSSEGRRVWVYIRDGQVVDVEEKDSNASRRRLIGEVVHWDKGRFMMRLCEVDRTDDLGVPTAVLLLQLARFHDEAHRRVA